jgi:beta-galactosidase
MRDKIKKFVEKGGILISTFLTSVKNEDNIGYTETLPAGLTELFGISVEEVEPVFQNNHTRLKLQQEELLIETKDGLWSELLAGDATMIGIYEEEYKKGCGVISEHNYGEGRAYYIGTDFEKDALKKLLTNIALKAGVKRNSIRGTEKLDIVQRKLDGKSVYFVFNFNSGEQQLSLPEKTTDYITGQEVGEVQTIGRNGFMVLMREE